MGLKTVLLTLISLILIMRPSHSADELTLTYGSLARTVKLQHLAQLCDTGTLPEEAEEFSTILATLAVDTDEMCDTLTEPIAIDVVEFDQALRSQIGEDLLFIAGQVIHNRPRVATITSLRGALITASEDGEINALEVLQHYPTPEVMIDLERLLSDDWVNDGLADFSRDFFWDSLDRTP
ncbi:MAG: alpha/beta hydrolase [Oscillatoriales cyanobacterium]|nr:MAG: alpha/beta hydrolase [Oscillatoriales cyanobacterium]